MKKAVCIFFFILVEIFLVRAGLQAQRTSVTLYYSFNPAMKGFDGKTTLYGNDHVFLLPELKGGSGYGIGLGTNVIEKGHKFYLGFRYVRTGYNATFLGKNLGTANNNFYGMEYKRFFPGEKGITPFDTSRGFKKSKIIQYYLSLGIELGNLKVKEGHYLLSAPDSFNDANFVLVALPLLVGISVSPVKAISLNLAAGYRIAVLAGAQVAGTKKQPFDIKENIGMGGIRCEAGLSFNF
jgi:hypothetical protein